MDAKELSTLMGACSDTSSANKQAKKDLYDAVRNELTGGLPLSLDVVVDACSEFKTNFEHGPAASMSKDELKAARRSVQSSIAYVNKIVKQCTNGAYYIHPLNRPKGAKAHILHWTYEWAPVVLKPVTTPTTVPVSIPVSIPPAAGATPHSAADITSEDVLEYIELNGLRCNSGIEIRASNGSITRIGELNTDTAGVFLRKDSDNTVPLGASLNTLLNCFGTVSMADSEPLREAFLRLITYSFACREAESCNAILQGLGSAVLAARDQYHLGLSK